MDEGFSSPYPGGGIIQKENSTTNLRRSCEACRASKGRCSPSRDDVRQCQRCARDGKQCVFLETKPRPRRIRTSKIRVAEMEQKLNGIFAMLSGSNYATLGNDLNLPEVPYPTPSTSSDLGDSVMVSRSHNTTMEALQPLAMTASSPSWLQFDELKDVIGKGIITYDKAESLLRIYDAHMPNFPFIVLSSTVSLDSLRHERPFLLLSILTVASTPNLQLQNRLETELRETLGRKVIFNGEKSLDLLQGLLVYLAWYHLFFTLERQQIYQLSQMVIAMAVDLEISRPGGDLRGSLTASILRDIHSNSIHAQGFPSEPETMRTFLGCYYLSSCLAIAFRKPNNLKYTDYVETCCQALSDAKETPSDFLLPYLIRLQRLAEEISSTFDYAGHQQLPALDAIRTEVLVNTFGKQLKQYEESFPSNVWHNVAIRMAFLHVNLYINEIGLHATRPDPVKLVTGQPDSREWYYSIARTDTLVACIESAKKYLDTYLRLSKEELSQNTIMEEVHLVYTILIIGRFTSGVDSPYLDAAHLRETAGLGHYMSALIEHFSDVIGLSGNGQERIDYFWHIRRIFQHVKNWYEEQVRGGYFTTMESSGIHNCLDLSFMDVLKMDTDPQYACETEFAQEAPVSEDELWTVAMLEPWPTSTLDPRVISLNGGVQ